MYRCEFAGGENDPKEWERLGKALKLIVDDLEKYPIDCLSVGEQAIRNYQWDELNRIAISMLTPELERCICPLKYPEKECHHLMYNSNCAYPKMPHYPNVL